MASQPDPSREPHTPLSKERVLRAAINLADQGGIESLSMRKVAQELGAGAMSLYHYVANKDDILDGIVDIVVSEMDVPSDGADWKAAIRRSAISAYEVLSRHPWACALMMSVRVRPARLRYMESLLGRLREAGFSAEITDHAYHALDSHIIGFTLWETGYSAAMKGSPNLAATFLRELPVVDFPYLAEHAQQHMRRRRPDEEGDFEFGLDLILNSLERLRLTVGPPEECPPNMAQP